MKRFISLLLVGAMLVSLVACAGKSTENVTGSTEEIDRAISHGLVPEEIQRDYDETITFCQYSQMLTNLISIWDESRLGEWEEIIAQAAESDEEMQREDGILATTYAMRLMGLSTIPQLGRNGVRVVQQQLYVGRHFHLCHSGLPGQRSGYLSL